MIIHSQLSDFARKIRSVTSKIFVVCGKTSFQKSGAEDVLRNAFEGVEICRFQDFSENPKFEDAVRGERLFFKFGADVILAVGGGSAIDIAKLIKAIHHHDGLPHQIVHGVQLKSASDTLLIAAPTTAGSGSEATHFAVMYLDEKKFSVAHADLLPNQIVLEPGLSQSMPPHLSACSGMDALCQAIESFWSTNSTSESDCYAREAIGLVLAHLPKIFTNPSLAHREGMMLAANLAGRAINITKTTGPHALSYGLTSQYGITHGHAVALFLPIFLAYNADVTHSDVNDQRGHEYVISKTQEIATLLGTSSIPDAVDRYWGLMSSIGLKTNLRALGISVDSIDHLAAGINTERLQNNPRKTTPETIRQIFAKAYC